MREKATNKAVQKLPLLYYDLLCNHDPTVVLRLGPSVRPALILAFASLVSAASVRVTDG